MITWYQPVNIRNENVTPAGSRLANVLADRLPNIFPSEWIATIGDPPSRLEHLLESLNQFANAGRTGSSAPPGYGPGGRVRHVTQHLSS